MYKYSVQDYFGTFFTTEAENFTVALEKIQEYFKGTERKVKIVHCYATMAVIGLFLGSILTRTYVVTWSKVQAQ